MEGIIIPLAFFALVFGMWYIYHTNRNRERLAMIEKGFDPSLFYSKKKSSLGFSLLKLGLVAAGVGLGLFVFSIMDAINMFGGSGGAALLGLMFLFGGAGLFGGYFYEHKREKNKSSEEKLPEEQDENEEIVPE